MINEQTFMRYNCKKLFYILELVGIVVALIFLGIYLIFGDERTIIEGAESIDVKMSIPHPTTLYITSVVIFVILSLIAILIVWKNVQSLMLVVFGFQVIWAIMLVINAIAAFILVIFIFTNFLTFKTATFSIIGFLLSAFIAAFNVVIAILVYRIWKARLMHSIEHRLSPKIQKF